MRLAEFDDSNAAAQRVKRLKADADSARDRAKQLKTKADTDSERLKMQQSREKLLRLNLSSAGATIKPHV